MPSDQTVGLFIKIPFATEARNMPRESAAQTDLMTARAELDRVGAPTDPGVVAEIGPGASIGAGLAALLAGAETYYGFDIKAYHHGERTLAVFDALVGLLSERAPVPDERELPNIKPTLDDHRFPAHILTDARLSRALAPERVARLRGALTDTDNPASPITYRAPWFESARIEYLNRIDLKSLYHSAGIGPILAAIGCNYRRQLTYPDTVAVGARISRLGRTSFEMEHVLYSTAQQTIIADGKSTIVVFDYRQQKPVPIPAEIRAKIEAIEGRRLTE